MIRKLLTAFVVPKLIAYVARRFGGRSATVPGRRRY